MLCLALAGAQELARLSVLLPHQRRLPDTCPAVPGHRVVHRDRLVPSLARCLIPADSCAVHPPPFLISFPVQRIPFCFSASHSAPVALPLRCFCHPPPADALLSVSKKFLAQIRDLGSAPVRDAVERFMPYAFESACTHTSITLPHLNHPPTPSSPSLLSEGGACRRSATVTR